MIPPSPHPPVRREEAEGLNLRHLVLYVWTRRLSVAGVAAAAGVLGLLVALLLPKWYQASAVILPPEQVDLAANLGVMGRALSKFPALGEFGEYSTPVDIYKAILKSRTVQNEIVDRFDLMQVYRIKSREKTLKAFARHTDVRMAPDGTIAISVEDRDPKRAADMTTAMLEGLDRFNIEKRNTQARRSRMFLEQRLASTDSLLRQSELALRRYQEVKRTVAPVALGTGDVSSAADLMARKVLLEVRLGILRGYLREDNDQVVQMRNELLELERQIGAFPSLQSELARLIRNNKVQEQLYLLLTAELERARMQELSNTPTVTVLDWPIPPERHSRPRKSIVALVSAMLGGLGAIVVLAFRERVPFSP